MDYPVNDRQIIRDCKIGEGTKVWNFVNMYECEVGRDSMIGTFVEIQAGVTIGDRTRVQSHTFVCELVTIGSDCFVGHGVMFINDTEPPQTDRAKFHPAILRAMLHELSAFPVGSLVRLNSGTALPLGRPR